MGYQAVVYVNHESCDCKRCTDIYSASSCTSTAPCPNEDNQDSFCYWTPTPSTASPVFNLGTVSPPSRCGPAASLRTELPTMALPDAGVCQCCEPRQCPPNQIFVPETCQCECPIECPSDKVLDETTCECICAVGCPPPQVLNEETCDCECRVRCSPPQVLNRNTCQCKCPIECPSDKVLDETMCKCKCAVSCPPPQVLNENTCGCECHVRCSPGLVLNRKTCVCECPEGFMRSANRECVGK